MIIRIPKDASRFITEEAGRRGIQPTLLAQGVFAQWVMEQTEAQSKKALKKQQRLKDKQAAIEGAANGK